VQERFSVEPDDAGGAKGSGERQEWKQFLARQAAAAEIKVSA